MKKSLLRRAIFALTVLLLSFPAFTAFGAANLSIIGASAILVEQDSGKVLYSLNPDQRMYPASMTKMVTALVVMEYLSLDDVVTVGDELDSLPYDSSVAGHVKGEHITVMNLLRGMLMESGNDSAIILAENAAEKASGTSMDYADAEKYFAGLMNKKAADLGATGTNFVNPHGFHDPNHYTTATDMVLFAQEFLKDQTLADIAKETEFKGNGMDNGMTGKTAADYDFPTQDYDWKTINLLLLPGDPHYYQYATGIKTGSTDEAGDCLTSAAEKNGVKLIAVVFKSTADGRYTDSITLLNYGFDNFSTKTVVPSGKTVLDTFEIDNPMLGADTEMDTYTSDSGFSGFYSQDEADAILSSRTVAYDPDLFTKDGKIIPPVTEGDVVGSVTYSSGGEVVFTEDIYAGGSAGARSTSTDFEYYKAKVKDNVFSLASIPYWLCLVLLIIIIILLASRGRKKKQRSYYRLNKRY